MILPGGSIAKKVTPISIENAQTLFRTFMSRNTCVDIEHNGKMLTVCNYCNLTNEELEHEYAQFELAKTYIEDHHDYNFVMRNKLDEFE